ncbi:MFS transporter [Actinomadura barringtoniae]|uniref:MFS transporter n=1 Tax=Actinomadura barringtoniae TaxID=1427535 RepID=A0A939PJP5_9ACTN|nr:MFS transporter [Actinomadura barringtoniae]MBO2454152.1 MFS transporter [Actinomadura barringtoniae]
MLGVLCAGMFLVLLDVTVVNVALPGIGTSLGTDLPGLQGVVDGYAVAIAGLLLGGGALGDRIGHRRMTLIGLGLFGVASLACGTAPGPESLIAARVVQGAGAALLLPGSLAVITAIYPGRAEQARALGVWAGISSTALPAGPLLGGALVDSVGWRWIFLVNVPIVAAAMVGVLALVREPRRPATAEERPLDRAGMILAPAALGTLVWTVIAAGHGQRGAAGAALIATLVLWAAFVVVERRATAPMVPGGLLRAPAFLGANMIALIMNLVTNGVLFVVTLHLQQQQGHSALTAGTMLLPMAVPLALLAPVSGRLTARFGTRLPLTAGTAIAAAGSLWLMSAGPNGSYVALLPVLVGIGVGDGLIVTAAVAGAMRAAPAEHAGLAGGFNNTARQVGTALGVAVYGAVAGSASRAHVAQSHAAQSHAAQSLADQAHAAHFTSGLHTLAWVSLGLWLVALALTRIVPAR